MCLSCLKRSAGPIVNFVSLVEKDFYNISLPSREIKNFMAREGDPKGELSGGPAIDLWRGRPARLANHFQGSLSMAHDGRIRIPAASHFSSFTFIKLRTSTACTPLRSSDRGMAVNLQTTKKSPRPKRGLSPASRFERHAEVNSQTRSRLSAAQVGIESGGQRTEGSEVEVGSAGDGPH